jgi:putative membrane protein
MGGSLLLLLIYSSVIYVLYSYTNYDDIAIPISVPTVLGTAISILLGFRTGSAYDRWWEARKIWGSIINDSRTLVRQATAFISEQNKVADVKIIAQRQIAWCYSLKNSLRGLEQPLEVKSYLDNREFSEVNKQMNVSNAILAKHDEQLASIFRQGNIDSFHFAIIDQTLKGLCDHMGKAERIKNTVFPMQYSSITRWTILLFLIILPFGMVKTVGSFVIPITLIVGFFFYLIHIIAHYLQDPFENREADIPMTSICRTIEINLLEMIGEEEPPKPISPDARGVLM